MDKIKKIFSPGSSKDDEVLYGDAEARRQASVSASKAPEQETETLRPVDASNKKEGGVLRQIINPGGEKYDDQAYGANATTEPADPNTLQTNQGQKDHTIIGQVLNPHHHKYDEQRFGTTAQTTGDGRRESVRPEVGQDAIVDPESTLATKDTAKDHSILRQIINPGSDKYDTVAYGQNASVVGAGEDPSQSGSAVAGPGSSNVAQQTASTVSDHSHLGRDAAIAGGVGATGAGAYAATQREHEPKDPSTSTQTNTDTTTTTAPSVPSQSTYQTTPQQSTYQSTAQPATYQSTTQPSAYQSTAQPSTYQPTTQQPDDSHFGRDAAIVGGAGVVGAGAYAATEHHNKPTEDSTDSKITDRAHPLGGMTTENTHVNPVSAPESTYQRTDDSHLGRDAAIVGGVGAAGAGVYGASQYNQTNDGSKITERPHPLSSRAGEAHVNPISAPEAPETQAGNQTYLGGAGIGSGIHNTDADQAVATSSSGQLNQAPADVQNATYTERAVPLGSGFHHSTGPHSTDTANRLDPHVPGEYPTETGEDRHGLNPASEQTTSGSGLGTAAGAGLVGAGTGAAAYGVSKDESSKQVPEQSAAAVSHPGGQNYPVPPSTSSSAYSQQPASQPTSQHHYGRDAAVAGGAGALGLGAYEATKSNPTAPTSNPYGPDSNPYEGGNTASNATPQVQPASQQQDSTHHYGRDAAVVGGTGVAGAAAYEATQGRGDTGPASVTTGPHDSNIANVTDPRVQPNTSQMKESTTTGPYQSDLANKADPRVDSDASKSDHKGRDGALVAGGVGAGAAAGYAVDEKEQKKLEKEHQKELKKEHKEAEKEHKAQQKEAEKEHKAQQKEAEKQEKVHQKEVAKQEKQHEKEVAKAEKQHEKEAAKAEKQHEKEVAKAEKQQEKEEKKHEKEAAAAAGAGVVGAGAYEAEKHHDASEQQGRASYDTNETGNSGSTEKKRGLLDKILHPTRKSEEDNRVAADDDGHNKLHKKHVPKESPLAGESSAAATTSAGPEYVASRDGVVTEPHTGLPMNVGTYGTGQGGTDGAEQIGGFHSHEGDAAATGPDWNAIKKENTPY